MADHSACFANNVIPKRPARRPNAQSDCFSKWEEMPHRVEIGEEQAVFTALSDNFAQRF
jgi:hypothetical protein